MGILPIELVKVILVSVDIRIQGDGVGPAGFVVSGQAQLNAVFHAAVRIAAIPNSITLVRMVCLAVDAVDGDLIHQNGREIRKAGDFGLLRFGEPDLDLAILIHRLNGVNSIIGNLDGLTVQGGPLILEAPVGGEGNGDILTVSGQDVVLYLGTVECCRAVVDLDSDLECIGDLGLNVKVCIEDIGGSRDIRSHQIPTTQIGVGGKGGAVLCPVDEPCPFFRGRNASQTDRAGGHHFVICIELKGHSLEGGGYRAKLRIGGFILNKYLPVVRCAVAGLLAVFVDFALLVLGVDNDERHVIVDIAECVLRAEVMDRNSNVHAIQSGIVQNTVSIHIKVDRSLSAVFNGKGDLLSRLLVVRGRAVCDLDRDGMLSRLGITRHHKLHGLCVVRAGLYSPLAVLIHKIDVFCVQFPECMVSKVCIEAVKISIRSDGYDGVIFAVASLMRTIDYIAVLQLEAIDMFHRILVYTADAYRLYEIQNLFLCQFRRSLTDLCKLDRRRLAAVLRLPAIGTSIYQLYGRRGGTYTGVSLIVKSYEVVLGGNCDLNIVPAILILMYVADDTIFFEGCRIFRRIMRALVDTGHLDKDFVLELRPCGLSRFVLSEGPGTGEMKSICPYYTGYRPPSIKCPNALLYRYGIARGRGDFFADGFLGIRRKETCYTIR